MTEAVPAKRSRLGPITHQILAWFARQEAANNWPKHRFNPAEDYSFRTLLKHGLVNWPAGAEKGHVTKHGHEYLEAHK